MRTVENGSKVGRQGRAGGLHQQGIRQAGAGWRRRARPASSSEGWGRASAGSREGRGGELVGWVEAHPNQLVCPVG